MTAQRIGILHPGQMGIVVAASAQNSGNEVFWASEARSSATRERASQAGLRDAGKTIFVVTHQASLLEGAADDFVWMEAGKIVSRTPDLATATERA